MQLGCPWTWAALTFVCAHESSMIEAPKEHQARSPGCTTFEQSVNVCVRKTYARVRKQRERVRPLSRSNPKSLNKLDNVTIQDPLGDPMLPLVETGGRSQVEQPFDSSFVLEFRCCPPVAERRFETCRIQVRQKHAVLRDPPRIEAGPCAAVHAADIIQDCIQHFQAGQASLLAFGDGVRKKHIYAHLCG